MLVCFYFLLHFVLVYLLFIVGRSFKLRRLDSKLYAPLCFLPKGLTDISQLCQIVLWCFIEWRLVKIIDFILHYIFFSRIWNWRQQFSNRGLISLVLINGCACIRSFYFVKLEIVMIGHIYWLSNINLLNT